MKETQKGVLNGYAILAVYIIVLLIYIFLSLNRKQPINSLNTTTITPAPTTQVKDIQNKILIDIGNDIDCSQERCKVENTYSDFAKGLMPMGYWIAKQTDGQWKVVITGNGIPQCNEIDKYEIPKVIFGNCIESDQKLRY